MEKLGYELLLKIWEFVTDIEEEEYWKETYRSFFQKKVMVSINPKEYFTKFVLPDIDEGWKNVNTIIVSPSSSTMELTQQEIEYQLQTQFPFDITKPTPCPNCYYHCDPLNIGSGPCGVCDSDHQIWVSWKQIQLISLNPVWKKYKRYRDFVRGVEWKEYLQEEDRYRTYLESFE